jgi:hypothetical protein
LWRFVAICGECTFGRAHTILDDARTWTSDDCCCERRHRNASHLQHSGFPRKPKYPVDHQTRAAATDMNPAWLLY